MKVTSPVVPLQSLWHTTPKPPPSKTEGGAPPLYSPINGRGGILSSHAAVKRKERRPGHPSCRCQFLLPVRFLTMAMATRFDRFDVGQCVGALIFVILLESHMVPRPLVFFIGPLVTLLCIYLIARPVPSERLWRASVIAISISCAGFLLTRYVFR
jgi:hypothetical protein